MASTYTPLGVEKMATGENAGTWGTKTNTNLEILEQISGGYAVQTLNAAGSGANTTTLSVGALPSRRYSSRKWCMFWMNALAFCNAIFLLMLSRDMFSLVRKTSSLAKAS